MTVLLALLFLVVPIAELYVLVQVAQEIGVLNSLALLVIISIAGAWLAKWAGIGVLNRLRQTVQAGRVPSAEVIDGFLVLFAAVLMLTPGFLTDILAIFLLLPPTRALVRGVLLRRFRDRAEIYVTGGRAARSFFGGRYPSDDITDVDGWERDPRPPGAPGSRPEELGP